MRLVAAVLCLLTCSAARAHDFWIEPATFRPAVGTPLGIVLREGERFVGVSQPYVSFAFRDFSLSGPGGRRPIRGSTGDDPAGAVTLAGSGLHVVGYHSTESFAESGPEKFAEYLRAEGLAHVLALRAARGESGLRARELFSRCAKALLLAGAPPGAGHDLILGYPLELVPRRNPYALRPGGDLVVEVLYEGAPLPGVRVVAFTAQDSLAKVSGRSDAEGRVSLVLDRPGRWLVKAVHLVELPPDHPRARWESFWASLTFELPPAPASAGDGP